MPTLLRWKGCRFYFWSHEGNEPQHTHIDCAEKSAKVWLFDLAVSYNEGFTSKEMKQLLGQVKIHRKVFKEAWHAHFE